MKFYSLLAAIFFITLNAFSQKEEAYFTKDSVSNVGFNVTLYSPAENARYCHIQYDNSVKKYTPQEVDEYGVKGRVFVAKKIEYKNEKKRVFLERLTTGKIVLYRYVTDNDQLYYYSNHNKKLAPLPKNKNGISYKETIKKLTGDCPEMTDKLFKRIKYKRNPMATAIRYYNICEPRYIPTFKTGLLVWLGLHKNTLTENMKLSTHTSNPLADLSYQFTTNLAFGAFIDIPINFTRHSFHIEAIINRYNHEFSESVIANYNYVSMVQADLVLKLKTTTLQLPVMYKYSIPYDKNLLFVNAGPVLGFTISDKSSLQYNFYNGATQSIDKELVDNISFGISAGLGAEFDITEKYKGITSLRYTMQSINNKETFIQHLIAINLGIFI